MREEIPIWVNGTIQWVSGVDKKTTCREVIEAVLLGEGRDRQSAKEFAIMERWRGVERPLEENSRILRIWSHWGDEKKEVRLCLKRIGNDADSGRGSPVGTGSTPQPKRRRHHRFRTTAKLPWDRRDALHQKRQAESAELAGDDRRTRGNRRWNVLDDGTGEEDEREKAAEKDEEAGGGESLGGSPVRDLRRGGPDRKSSFGKTDAEGEPHRKGGGRSRRCVGTGFLHSTLLSANGNDVAGTASRCCSKRQPKSKVRNSESIEKLMKLILAQGATIRSQLEKLKEREEQIESLEHERHRERIEKNGRNYLLETYLGSLKEAEIPVSEKVEDAGGGVKGVGERKILHLVEWTSTTGANFDSAAGTERRQDEESDNEAKASSRRAVHGRDRANGRPRKIATEKTETETAVDGGRDESRGPGEGNERREEVTGDLPKLENIRSQVEAWEKIFKINKRLEREEENLLRLHTKIKRFEAEEKGGANGLERDRRAIEERLEILQGDLDASNREICENTARIRESEEAVRRKRNVLKRLLDDLEETEQEHEALSELALASPAQGVQDHEGRTSFSSGTPALSPVALPDSSCRGLDPGQKTVENRFAEESSRLATFLDKGVLETRDQDSRPSPSHFASAQVQEVRDRFGPILNRKLPRGPKIGGAAVGARFHNDTDSSASSDTSGMCSMYSSSPTAEDPYAEPCYALDTLV